MGLISLCNVNTVTILTNLSQKKKSTVTMCIFVVLSDYVVSCVPVVYLRSKYICFGRGESFIDHLLLEACLAGTDGMLIQCLVILPMELNIVALILNPRPI